MLPLSSVKGDQLIAVVTARAEAPITGPLLLQSEPQLSQTPYQQDRCKGHVCLTDARAMSASAYLLSRGHLYFLVGWRWSHLAFILNPLGGTESVLSSCVQHKPQRENTLATSKGQGWSPLGKSGSQTLHQRVWNKKNFSN